MKKISVAVILGISLMVASCSHSSESSTSTNPTVQNPTITTLNTLGLDISTISIPDSCSQKQEFIGVISISLDAEGEAGNIDLPTIKNCDLVAITITWAESDTIKTEEVHLHGYDHKWEISNNGIAETFGFYADIPGQFDVELEESHIDLFTLRVN